MLQRVRQKWKPSKTNDVYDFVSSFQQDSEACEVKTEMVSNWINPKLGVRNCRKGNRNFNE